MKWNEFIEKIKTAKANKLHKSLKMSCIANLIFSGAMDEMIGGSPKMGEMFDTYMNMFEEIKKAIGSKAALPKKTKNMPLGLSDIQNDTQLGLWRYIVNPTSKFNFLEGNLEFFKSRGFKEPCTAAKEAGIHKYFPLTCEGDVLAVDRSTYMIKNWGAITDNPFPDRIVKDKFLRGDRYAAIAGVIYKKEMRKFGDNRMMMKLSIYNGEELVDNIVVWPKRDGRLPEWALGICEMQFGILIAQPKMYKGQLNGTAMGWSRYVNF